MGVREMSYEELEGKALEYVVEYPESPIAWFLYSHCLLELEKYKEALTALDMLETVARSSSKIDEMRKKALEGAVV